MLMGRAILLLGLVVLLVNVACHRPLPQTLLFSFALALGMTPKVMPAIVAIAQKRATRRTQRKEGVSRLLLARGHFGGGATGGPSRATHAAGK
jgi:Mg2+-importing ATPase